MQHPAERAQQGGFAEAGHTFQQHVASGQQADQNAIHHRLLTDDDLADFLPKLVERAGGELEPGVRSIHVSILAVKPQDRWKGEAGQRGANIAAGVMASGNSSQSHPERRLTDLRNGLLGLHKTLLDSERARYERDIARIHSSNELLHLVLYDPWFAWLHELSELVVLIDETLDAERPPNGFDADRLIAQARELLTPNESGRGFEKSYFEALQRDPDVVLSHAKTRKLVLSLE